MGDRYAVLENTLGSGGRLGIAAALYEPGGAATSRTEFNADEPFPLASLVKVATAGPCRAKAAQAAQASTTQP